MTVTETIDSNLILICFLVALGVMAWILLMVVIVWSIRKVVSKWRYQRLGDNEETNQYMMANIHDGVEIELGDRQIGEGELTEEEATLESSLKPANWDKGEKSIADSIQFTVVK